MRWSTWAGEAVTCHGDLSLGRLTLLNYLLTYSRRPLPRDTGRVTETSPSADVCCRPLSHRPLSHRPLSHLPLSHLPLSHLPLSHLRPRDRPPPPPPRPREAGGCPPDCPPEPLPPLRSCRRSMPGGGLLSGVESCELERCRSRGTTKGGLPPPPPPPDPPETDMAPSPGGTGAGCRRQSSEWAVAVAAPLDDRRARLEGLARAPSVSAGAPARAAARPPWADGSGGGGIELSWPLLPVVGTAPNEVGTAPNETASLSAVGQP